MKRKFFIETFGCQMNKNDSELMRLSLTEHGYEPCEDIMECDIAVFNTCSVRSHAEERAVSRIRAVAGNVRSRNGIVAVTGCMAQRLSQKLIDDGTADLIVGPYQSPEIGKILDGYLSDGSSRSFVSLDSGNFSGRIKGGLAAIGTGAPWHRWVTITHGCENFCTYCIVPHVRGKLISMPSEKILEYIKSLASSGTREITLLGQNVNQYGMDTGDLSFHTLLERTAGISGIEKINFLTSHPMDFTENLVMVIADHENISRSIHLPLQSGSDRVLAAMNRKYTMSHYMGIIESIRGRLASHSISTDLIVGFPGEEESDFRETLAAVERIQFDDAFTYAYSPREGTPAALLHETLSRQEKISRLQELIGIQRKISLNKLKNRVDKIEDVIIERLSKKSPESVMGKTSLNHPVVVAGTKEDIGKRMRIRIERVVGSTLQGVRIA